MPRKAHSPTPDTIRTVQAMAAYGIRQEEIAAVIGISDETLRKHYRRTLDTAATEANVRVAESLFKQAVGAPAEYDSSGRVIRAEQPRTVAAAIFWMKTRGGWKETSRHEVANADGEAFKFQFEGLTDGELKAVEKALAIAARATGDPAGTDTPGDTKAG